MEMLSHQGEREQDDSTDNTMSNEQVKKLHRLYDEVSCTLSCKETSDLSQFFQSPNLLLYFASFSLSPKYFPKRR